MSDSTVVVASSSTDTSSTVVASKQPPSWIKWPRHCAYFRYRRDLTEEGLSATIKHLKDNNIVYDDYMVPFLKGRQNESITFHRPHPCTRFNRFTGTGCNRRDCNYAHNCLICNSTKHGVYDKNEEGVLLCKQHIAFNKEYEQLIKLYPEVDADNDFFHMWLDGESTRTSVYSAKTPKTAASVVASASSSSPSQASSSVPSTSSSSELVLVAAEEDVESVIMKMAMQIGGLNICADSDTLSLGGLKTGARFIIEHDALKNKSMEFSTMGKPNGRPLRHMTIHISY